MLATPGTLIETGKVAEVFLIGQQQRVDAVFFHDPAGTLPPGLKFGSRKVREQCFLHV